MSAAEILPCPFCSGACVASDVSDDLGELVRIECLAGFATYPTCNYRSGEGQSEAEAIQAHNRVAGSAGLLRDRERLLRDCRKYLEDALRYTQKGVPKSRASWPLEVRGVLVAIARIDALEPEA